MLNTTVLATIVGADAKWCPMKHIEGVSRLGMERMWTSKQAKEDTHASVSS